MIFTKQRVRQLRKGVKSKINESPATIIIQRKPSTSNGFGGQTINPYGTATTESIKVRISHEKSMIGGLESVPSGLSTNLQRFILVDHNADIQENDVFEYIEKTWKIGPVDPLMQHESVIAYQAPITEVV